MNLENQVTNLELSKKLKELGVKQESLFYWIKGIEIAEYPEGEDSYESWFQPFEGLVTQERAKVAINIKDSGDWEEEDIKDVDYYSAFTVAELGEMLPSGIWFERTKEDNRFRCGQTKYLGTVELDKSIQFGDSEADARAKMLIYLLENHLIKL